MLLVKHGQMSSYTVQKKRLGQVLCAMLIFDAHNERTFYFCYALMNEIQVLNERKKIELTSFHCFPCAMRG